MFHVPSSFLSQTREEKTPAVRRWWTSKCCISRWLQLFLTPVNRWSHLFDRLSASHCVSVVVETPLTSLLGSFCQTKLQTSTSIMLTISQMSRLSRHFAWFPLSMILNDSCDLLTFSLTRSCVFSTTGNRLFRSHLKPFKCEHHVPKALSTILFDRLFASS